MLQRPLSLSDRLSPAVWSVAPGPLLESFIDRIWGMEMSSETPHPLFRALPGTGAEIFIHLGEPFHWMLNDGGKSPLDRGHFLALRNESIDLAPARNIDFIAIRFKSGGASRFLGAPLPEYLDRPIPLWEVMGSAASRLMEDLNGTRNRDLRVALVRDFLVGRLGQGAWFDPRITTATRNLYYHHCGVQELADRLGLGKRQLEKRFKSCEGLSPVAFRQLARFQRTLKTLLLDPGQSLVQAGMDFGYADQPHMTREFRAITKRSPERLRDEMGRSLSFYFRTSANLPRR